MARNPVQFQKGISLNEFLSLYGTEQQCFDALYHWRWPNGFVCPNCGHDRGCQLTTHKLQQCYRCNRQTSITAGTIFEATKLPLTVWFQGIYFMTQDKKGASAMKLHRQLGISYNAAWRMRHKLMQVMMERDRAHPLGGFIQLDDAYLGGERSGGKRGRGAPGKTPFVAAVETNAEGHPLRVKLTVVEGFRLTEIAAWAQQHLSPGTQVLSDGLACFNGVTAAGCVHESMVTGGGKAAVERPEHAEIGEIVQQRFDRRRVGRGGIEIDFYTRLLGDVLDRRLPAFGDDGHFLGGDGGEGQFLLFAGQRGCQRRHQDHGRSREQD